SFPPYSAHIAYPTIFRSVLIVANVSEDDPDALPSAVSAHASHTGALAVAVSARLESELAEMDAEEAAAMREELGIPESGLERVGWDEETAGFLITCHKVL